MLRPTMSYMESIERLQMIVTVYYQTMDKKKAFQKKGEVSIEVNREIERLLNDIQFITGERDISFAEKILSQYDNSKKK